MLINILKIFFSLIMQ